MSSPPNLSYLAAHRYDHDRVEIDNRAALTPLTMRSRDLAIVRDVWRYKLLACAQLQELWWPQRSPRAAQKRLTKLFAAGQLERFRPVTRRGSYPWIYQLGPEGHKLLKSMGLIERRQRYERRDVYDYTYVLHDLHVNSWVLAYRRMLGDALLSWEGETVIDPPRPARGAQLPLDDNWSAEGLKAPQARTVAPDALLEIARTDREGSRLFLIEYDRTTRVDKNYEKFRRYDAFLNWWWQQTAFLDGGEPPWVLFVCQNEAHLEKFLAAADRDLTGHHWHPSVDGDVSHYVGRRRLLFAREADAHAGILEARRVPGYPPGHPDRRGPLNDVRRVRLAGPNHGEPPAAGARADAPEHALARSPAQHLTRDPELVMTSGATETAERVGEFLGGRSAKTQSAIASEE